MGGNIMSRSELVYSFVPFYPASIGLTELAKKSGLCTGSLTSIIATITIEHMDLTSVYEGRVERLTRVKDYDTVYMEEE
jgi:hypothetical protein